MILVIALLYMTSSHHSTLLGFAKLSHILLQRTYIFNLTLQPLWLCTSKIGFSKGMVFEIELSLLPKVVLGARGVFKFAGSVSQGFSAAVGSSFRKLTEKNSRV